MRMSRDSPILVSKMIKSSRRLMSMSTTERSLPRVTSAIVSGDSVMQNADRRDEASRRIHNAIYFKMEIARVIDKTRCLVIRGNSDYCDSHKNGVWYKTTYFHNSTFECKRNRSCGCTAKHVMVSHRYLVCCYNIITIFYC